MPYYFQLPIFIFRTLNSFSDTCAEEVKRECTSRSWSLKKTTWWVLIWDPASHSTSLSLWKAANELFFFIQAYPCLSPSLWPLWYPMRSCHDDFGFPDVIFYHHFYWLEYLNLSHLTEVQVLGIKFENNDKTLCLICWLQLSSIRIRSEFWIFEFFKSI